MPTESFFESLKLRSEEELRIIEKLIDEADARPPVQPYYDIMDELKRTKKRIEEGFFNKM